MNAHSDQASRALRPWGWWGGYCLSLAPPVFSLAFLLSGPHPWWGALCWISAGCVFVLADSHATSQRGAPPAALRDWPYDLLLYLIVALQVAVVLAVADLALQLQWHGRLPALNSMVELAALRAIVGGNTSICAGVVGHELMHRGNQWQRRLGRALLTLMCYEHFYTEHLAGHHRRVGQWEDPATARFGETFDAYFRRTVPQQFRSAWRLEWVRLARNGQRGWWRHRVLQGVAVELGLVAWLWIGWGGIAAVAFLLQAYSAVVKLEAINYIEHWGLSRCGSAVTAEHAWETDSWFTLHTVIGLSRHADHHLFPSRPYYRLECQPNSPRLVYGYFAMTYLATLRNTEFQRLAVRELQARRLGPFAPLRPAPEPAKGGTSGQGLCRSANAFSPPSE